MFHSAFTAVPPSLSLTPKLPSFRVAKIPKHRERKANKAARWSSAMREGRPFAAAAAAAAEELEKKGDPTDRAIIPTWRCGENFLLLANLSSKESSIVSSALG